MGNDPPHQPVAPSDAAAPPVYGKRPSRDTAEALLRRRINLALRHRRGGTDLRDSFALRPILFRTNSLLSGRPYLVRRWGVWVDGDMVGYVGTNYEGTRIRFFPSGLATGEYLIDEEAETAEALAKA